MTFTVPLALFWYGLGFVSGVALLLAVAMLAARKKMTKWTPATDATQPVSLNYAVNGERHEAHSAR